MEKEDKKAYETPKLVVVGPIAPNTAGFRAFS
jgi:hypothetical protein